MVYEHSQRKAKKNLLYKDKKKKIKKKRIHFLGIIINLFKALTSSNKFN